jgi:ankyrin repeat protein/Mg2+ and Co2+ transporter CorA
MGRPPSLQSDGASSTHHVRAEPRLLKAIEERHNDAAIAIIEDAKAHARPIELLLRIGLMRASERGNIAIAEYLLQNGAKANGAPGGRASPLLRAVEKNDVGIVRVLLRFGGDVDVCDKRGRTALMTAAWKNHWHVLDELLKRGADVNKKDHKGRNVLHNLAADKQCNWGSSVIELLLRTGVVIDGEKGQDETKRSPLHWAASTGKKELCEMLLTRQKGLRANINAVEGKEKTALHLAVAHGRDDIVELLIRYGANVKARSDGKWTALHNACQQGSVKMVRMLLGAGADINARLLNGMTPLHIAAQNDHLDVVQCLLEREDCKRTARDAFGITPFILAAKQKNRDIVNKLAPFNQLETLSKDALCACQGFSGTIVDFGNFHNENRVTKRSVFEILYAKDPNNPRKPAFSVLPKQEKSVDFRWIHLPANNLTWVEALLTKAFVEEGAHDVPGYIALERSFAQQHRGQQVHSHFMRPLCQSIPRQSRVLEDSDFSDSADHGPPAIVVSQGSGSGLGIDAGPGHQEHHPPPVPKSPVRTGTVSTDQTDWTIGTVGSGSGKENKPHKSKEKNKKTPKWSGGRQAGGRSGGTDTPPRRENHQRPRQSSTPLSGSLLKSPGSPGRKETALTAKGNIFTFMPYLHFETNANRQEMQDAIARAQYLKEKEKHDGLVVKPMLKKAETYDEMLLRAHLGSSTVSLHVRRTLDQFFYHNIDTQSRDQDQVVYRYQTRRMASEESEVDPKVFMVDQLWMWILGKDLIVTAFPQRWQQPRNDPLNVLDGIIENINSNTREPVQSVYDLAMVITNRCSGVFDRHRMGDEDYQFLDMFESSIGEATETETRLFEYFNAASKKASAWLQHHRRPNRFSRHLEAEIRHMQHQNKRGTHSHSHHHALATPPVPEDDFHDASMGPAHSPLFVDDLLDIGAETDLLTEIKDIRDEIAMITKVLDDQRTVLEAMEPCIVVSDLDRMDKQASRIYESITDLLDLKQKHANAFEARFARDQAAGTARQSQTIMVFTIVTIIFLPLSFIAALFTVNVREFPHLPGGDQPSLPLSYVAKFMFGIGFAVSLPMIFVALSLDAIGDFFREVRRRWGEVRKQRAQAQAQRQGAGPSLHNSHSDEKLDGLGAAADVRPAHSSRGRASIESYLSAGGAGGSLTLLPVASRAPSSPSKNPGFAGSLHGSGGGGVGRRGSSAGRSVRRPRPPTFPERASTGFRMRGSADVERGM